MLHGKRLFALLFSPTSKDLKANKSKTAVIVEVSTQPYYLRSKSDRPLFYPTALTYHGINKFSAYCKASLFVLHSLVCCSSILFYFHLCTLRFISNNTLSYQKSLLIRPSLQYFWIWYKQTLILFLSKMTMVQTN